MTYKSVERALWPESAAALSPEQGEMIRQVLSELLTDSIDETLLRMRLSGMTIAGFWPVQSVFAAETEFRRSNNRHISCRAIQSADLPRYL